MLHLQNGIFTNDKSSKAKYKGKFRKRAGNYIVELIMTMLTRIGN